MAVMCTTSGCPSTPSRNEGLNPHHTTHKSKPSLKQRVLSIFGKCREREVIQEADAELKPATVIIAHYKPESLESLMETCKFSKKELQTMYRGFKQECPSGQVDEVTFQGIYSQFFPFSESSSYAHFVFNAFDKDKSGSLTFEEFVRALSTLSRGTIDEKLDWLFNLYDLDGNGLVTRREFADVIASVYEMMGNSTSPPIDDALIQNHVDHLFKKIEGPTAALTQEEFITLVRESKFFEESIHMFDTQI